MKCPHCSKEIYFKETAGNVYPYTFDPYSNQNRAFQISQGLCPACSELIILRNEGWCQLSLGDYDMTDVDSSIIIFPSVPRRKVDEEVPERQKRDYLEAASVLSISPKASAAISRRLLQDILREHFKIKPSSLSSEIDSFLKLPIPTYLSEAIDAIRIVGNFAAHPLKDVSTGEVVDVEPGEAEWLLEVLDSLFDYAFVQPCRLEARKDQLNEKLSKVGKPPLKATGTN